MPNLNIKLRPYEKSFPFSYSFGVYPTIELLENHPETVLTVLLNSKGDRNTGVDKIIRICQKQDIKTEIADGLITKLTGNENTYALGVFTKYDSTIAKDTNHLVLVNPSDTGNLGTIVRTMLGYGLNDLVIIRPSVDLLDPKTVRASMGAVFTINFQYFPDFRSYQTLSSRHLYPFLTSAATDLEKVTLKTPYSLIFGNESSGLDASYLQCGTAIKITQSTKIDSLNLSIAVGIALYRTYQK